MALHPAIRDATALSQLDVHLVAPGDNLQASVRRRRRVDGEVRRDMLDLADVVVGRRIQVSLEAVALGRLVVDLVLEQRHFAAADLREDAAQALAVKQRPELWVVVCELLRAHELPFTLAVDFVVGHPFAFLARPLRNLVGPGL